MKITKDFSPVTIQIETLQDLNDLKEILALAYRSDQPRWSVRGRSLTELQEKILDFLKKLGEV